MSTSLSANVAAGRSRAGWRRSLLFIVSLVLLWVVLFKGCAMVCFAPGPPKQPDWTAASGKPVPPQFGFLGFPSSATVKLFDAPDGAEAGTLDRAVVLGVNEESGEWVRVAGNPASVVRRSDMALVPPVDWQAWFESYKKARLAREGVDFVGASFQTERLSDGRLRVVFSESWDDWREVSTYTVEDGRGLAQEFVSEGKEAGFEGAIVFWMRARWAVPVTWVCGGVGTFLLWRMLLKKKRVMGAATSSATAV